MCINMWRVIRRIPWRVSVVTVAEINQSSNRLPNFGNYFAINIVSIIQISYYFNLLHWRLGNTMETNNTPARGNHFMSYMWFAWIEKTESVSLRVSSHFIHVSLALLSWGNRVPINCCIPKYTQVYPRGADVWLAQALEQIQTRQHSEQVWQVLLPTAKETEPHRAMNHCLWTWTTQNRAVRFELCLKKQLIKFNA